MRLMVDGTPPMTCYNEIIVTIKSEHKIGEEMNMLAYAIYTLRNQKGQGMVEYGLILALVAVVVIGALTLMGTNITAKFTTISTAL
jgi:pilus assembly protein Flp/PilA